MAKKSDNIIWLAGDRFFCVNRKQEIVSETIQDENWGTKDISHMKTVDQISNEMLTRDFFDKPNSLFIYDGLPPEPKKLHAFLNKYLKNNKIVFITGKPDKRTVFAKIFKPYLQSYEPVLDSNGRPQKKLIPDAIRTIKSISNWKGKKEVLDFIFEMTDYNCGASVLEIDKVRLYTEKKDKEISIQDCRDIICETEKLMNDDLVNAVTNCDRRKSIQHVSDMLRSSENQIATLYLLLEHFYFMWYCSVAFEEGLRNNFQIGKRVSEMWIKKTGPVTPGSIAFRYDLHERGIRCRSSESILKSINRIERTVSDIMNYKNRSSYFMKQLIFEIS